MFNILGNEIKLTAAEIKELKKQLDNFTTNNFIRQKRDKSYYYISTSGLLYLKKENDEHLDRKNFFSGNYCSNEEIMRDRGKEEVLNRLLWRFSLENGGNEIDWNNSQQEKYFIEFNHWNKKFAINSIFGVQILNVIYFISKEVAQKAIDEIIIPFKNGTLPICEYLD
jgi:hypothetical protein